MAFVTVGFFRGCIPAIAQTVAYLFVTSIIFFTAYLFVVVQNEMMIKTKEMYLYVPIFENLVGLQKFKTILILLLYIFFAYQITVGTHRLDISIIIGPSQFKFWRLEQKNKMAP